MQNSAGLPWDQLRIGDAAPPHVYQVTAERIARYCRAARYENLIYSNQPAARETGLPGIIAPPAMVFVYAPAQVLAWLPPDRSQPGQLLPSPVRIQLTFQGTLVLAEETITSVTRIEDQLTRPEQRLLVLRVVAHNQRGEPVAEYVSTYGWGEPAN
jgi:acyl dehydratase